VLEKEPASYRAYYWKAMVAKARGRLQPKPSTCSRKSIEFNQGPLCRSRSSATF